jgi:hypothetical protein
MNAMLDVLAWLGGQLAHEQELRGLHRQLPRFATIRCCAADRVADVMVLDVESVYSIRIGAAALAPMLDRLEALYELGERLGS